MKIQEQWISGEGGLPKIIVTAEDGARAEIYLHGAQACSWRTPDGRERLFLSSRAQFAEGTAIRGGVPIIFPQFSALGSLPKHGFARTASWQYLGIEQGERAAAVFLLQANENTRRVWPHDFSAELAVHVGGERLELLLKIVNTGETAFNFTAALHSYIRVSDVEQVSVQGLQGLAYVDTAAGETPAKGASMREHANELRIRGEVDRIYFGGLQPIAVSDLTERIVSRMSGFKDVVLWNPGAQLGAALKDMEPDGYRSMLCVEAAAIARPIILGPGEHWSGAQALTVENAN